MFHYRLIFLLWSAVKVLNTQKPTLVLRFLLCDEPSRDGESVSWCVGLLSLGPPLSVRVRRAVCLCLYLCAFVIFSL